jgi:hypothetical protein
MPKKHNYKHRRMGGGILDSLFGTKNNSYSNKSQGQSNSMFSNWFGSPSNTGSTYGTDYPSSNTGYGTGSTGYGRGGGKSRKHRRHMKGGYKDNISTTNLAANAAPFSGTPTAKPHTWVGGKTRKHRKHRHSKSCKHRH